MASQTRTQERPARTIFHGDAASSACVLYYTLEAPGLFDDETHEVRVKIDGGVRPMQKFDGCFGQDSTETMVYQETANDIVRSVLDGYNATLIAYGMTGSGKTYTMMGSNYNAQNMKNAGVIPQAIQNIFGVHSG